MLCFRVVAVFLFAVGVARAEEDAPQEAVAFKPVRVHVFATKFERLPEHEGKKVPSFERMKGRTQVAHWEGEIRKALDDSTVVETAVFAAEVKPGDLGLVLIRDSNLEHELVLVDLDTKKETVLTTGPLTLESVDVAVDKMILNHTNPAVVEVYKRRDKRRRERQEPKTVVAADRVQRLYTSGGVATTVGKVAFVAGAMGTMVGLVVAFDELISDGPVTQGGAIMEASWVVFSAGPGFMAIGTSMQHAAIRQRDRRVPSIPVGSVVGFGLWGTGVGLSYIPQHYWLAPIAGFPLSAAMYAGLAQETKNKKRWATLNNRTAHHKVNWSLTPYSRQDENGLVLMGTF